MPRAVMPWSRSSSEELAPAAAHVEHVAGAREAADVVEHPLADVVLAAAEGVFEAGVLMAAQGIVGEHLLRAGRWTGSGHRGRRPVAGARRGSGEALPTRSRWRRRTAHRLLFDGHGGAQIGEGLAPGAGSGWSASRSA